MSSRKKRSQFNHAWRKARKILRKGQTKARVGWGWTPEELELAVRYKIDVLAGEKVK